MLGISLSKYRNICIDPKKYYLFIRNKSDDVNKKRVYETNLRKIIKNIMVLLYSLDKIYRLDI